MARTFLCATGQHEDCDGNIMVPVQDKMRSGHMTRPCECKCHTRMR